MKQHSCAGTESRGRRRHRPIRSDDGLIDQQLPAAKTTSRIDTGCHPEGRSLSTSYTPDTWSISHYMTGQSTDRAELGGRQEYGEVVGRGALLNQFTVGFDAGLCTVKTPRLTDERATDFMVVGDFCRMYEICTSYVPPRPVYGRFWPGYGDFAIGVSEALPLPLPLKSRLCSGSEIPNLAEKTIRRHQRDSGIDLYLEEHHERHLPICTRYRLISTAFSGRTNE